MNMQAMTVPMKKPQQASDQLPYLPQDVISYILFFLPIKTIIKCRCVSKSWFSLISNINFIQTHLRKSSTLNNFSRRRLILGSHGPVKLVEKSLASIIRNFNSPRQSDKIYCPFIKSTKCYPQYLKSSSIDSIFSLRTDDHKYIQLDYPSNDPKAWMSIVGSCDGLICIGIKNQITLLWNPSTRESKVLPSLGGILQFHLLRMYGFGYDQLSDDYKVVITKFCDNCGHESCKGAMVYSLRTNLWRKIKKFPHLTISHMARGVFVNGVIHWETIVPSASNYSSQIIVSFDLGKETYGKIAQPNYGSPSNFKWSLGVLEECLSVCCYSVGICVDIWVMKAYSVRDSWTKMHTIQNLIVKEDFHTFRCFPVWFSLTGELFLKFRDRFVRYDPKNGTFEDSVIHSSTILNHEPITYVESLVSPNIYNEVRIPYLIQEDSRNLFTP